ncbi:MAG: hypothetical protein H7Y03_11310 [Chitinophagaceae bacterium]|nr:hypothetical protein [Chitinophagaceae bacterium]
MKIIFTVGVFFILLATTFAQGCSDAGFCSLGGLKGSKPFAVIHLLSIGSGFGAGEEGTSIIQSYLEYTYRHSDKWSFQTKLTSLYASGFLGKAFNLGDIYGLATYSLSNSKRNKWSLLGGFKIPLTASNAKHKGRPLPMDYQSGVGTYDIIAGVNYLLNEEWEFSTGVQIPLININKNTFFPDEYEDIRATNFSPTNNFRRNADVLLRVGRAFNAGNNLTLKPSLLSIFHVGEDSYENRFGRRSSIDGSGGLTLNAGLNVTKSFSDGNQLELIVASPFIVREERPDGLTRSFVVNLQYSFSL